MKWGNGLNLEGAQRALVNAAERAVERITDDIYAASQKYVPDDPGTGGNDLRGSGRKKVTREAGSTVGAVGYGTKYGVIQHERLDYRHKRGQTAKYLERALGEASKDAAKIVADEVGKVTK